LKAMGLNVPQEGLKIKYIPDQAELDQVRAVSAQLAREHVKK
jgi:hypothetical protein